VTEAAGVAARRTVSFDMEALALKHGSVISATMFGALAGADVLPFPREAFEAVIAAAQGNCAESGRLRRRLRTRAGTPAAAPLARTPPKRFDSLPQSTGHPDLDALLGRIARDFRPPFSRCCLPGQAPRRFSGPRLCRRISRPDRQISRAR